MAVAKKAQKEFLIEVIVGKKMNIKLSNVNKLAVNKLFLTYNVSMGAGKLGAGSRSHATYRRPSLDGF